MTVEIGVAAAQGKNIGGLGTETIMVARANPVKVLFRSNGDEQNG
jgi:hypothetical protein